jgi:hypothetical protein
LLDLIEVAASGLMPKSQYQIYLAESDYAPFGKLVPLGTLKTNPDGAGIAQAIGPLKALAGQNASPSTQRFLIITDAKNSSQVILKQGSGTGH